MLLGRISSSGTVPSSFNSSRVLVASMADQKTSDVMLEEAVRTPSREQVDELKRTTTVDTVHNDEAVKVLATYHGDEHWTEAEEKRLLRRIDWKLMPLLCLTYGLQYYDKAMLSQAVRDHRDANVASADCPRPCSAYEQTSGY